MRGSPPFFFGTSKYIGLKNKLGYHSDRKHTFCIVFSCLVRSTVVSRLMFHLFPIHVSIRFHLSIPFLHFLSNVGKTINHPFGNGLHNLINLFMVILGVVYSWFNHIIGLPALDSTPQVQPHTNLEEHGRQAARTLSKVFRDVLARLFFTTLGGLAFWGMSSGAFP